jgi:ABC-type Fe3+ transport system substrate-binding protein
MRRAVPIVLFFLVLLTPFLLKRLYGTESHDVARAGELRLVVITPHVESIRREFAEAFSKWHQERFGQPVFIDYRAIGGTNEIVRFFESAKATVFDRQGTFRIDVAWGGGDFLFDQQLKKLGVLEPLKLPDETMRYAFPKPELAGAALYDVSGGTWFGTCLSTFGICYNRDVCRVLGVGEPKTWEALAGPKLRGWVLLADPTRSGSANTALMTVVEKEMVAAHQRGESEDAGWARGMGLIRQIAANARQFTDASSSTPVQIAQGDAAAGMTIDFYGRSEVDAVGDERLGYIEPAGATTLSADPVAVVRGAEHRELAIRFVEFLLSEPAQKLWNTRAGAPGGPRLTSLRRLPIAPSVYRDMRDFTDPVDPFTQKIAFEKSPARQRTFRIVGTLIGWSCVDLLDELRETRRAILAANRLDLDAKLGVFPFGEAEALRRDAQLRQASVADRLRLEREWKQQFRDEYRRLREAASGTAPP